MGDLHSSFQPTLTESGLKCLGLSLESIRPNDVLTGVIHSYLQIRAKCPTPYPVIPDGSQSIFISPDGSMIGGAQSQARDMRIRDGVEYFGIRFFPGALQHFFSLDVSEITDQFVDESYLPCRDFGRLHNAIYRCKSFNERADVCEKWLLKHYTPKLFSNFDQVLSWICQSNGNTRIDHLAESVGLSSRHLN